MPWMLYRTHQIEDEIAEMYQSHGIHSPADMTLDRIADAFGVAYSYYHGRSFVYYNDDCDEPYILIDERLSETEQRAEFFHELCHPLRHSGCQTNMSKLFKELQEFQAGMFQLYASMPFYMIQEMPLPELDRHIIGMWAAKFDVPPELASKRLEQIRRRILVRKLDEQQAHPALPAETHEEQMGIIVTYPETERLLRQLYQQTRKRRLKNA